MGNAGLFKTAQPIFSLKAIDNSYIKGCILTGLKEKYTGNLTSGKILENKIVNFLIEETCATNQIACEIAIKKMGAIMNIVYHPMLFCRNDRPLYNVAGILGAQSDLVLLSSTSLFCLKKLTSLSSSPSLNILNCAQCPSLSFAAMMCIYERFRRFENLNVSLIGRPYPYFNSLLLLLPRLNVNARILTGITENSRISPRYFAVAQDFAIQAGREILDCRSLAEALDGANVVMVSQNIWDGFKLYMEDIQKYCDKDWCFFHDPFDGSLFDCDLFGHENTMSFKLIENLRWAYFTIILEVFRMRFPECAEKIAKLQCKEEASFK